MSVYMIFSFNVVDQERFAPYRMGVTPLLLKHGAEVLVADFQGQSLEGQARDANVVIRFPSAEQANAFYNDPAYAPLKKLRLECTADGTATLTEEFVPPTRA